MGRRAFIKAYGILHEALVLVTAIACRPDDPDPHIQLFTGEIEEIVPTYRLIHGKIFETGLEGIEQGAWLRGLHTGRGEILHERYAEKNAFSVRCIKDR